MPVVKFAVKEHLARYEREHGVRLTYLGASEAMGISPNTIHKTANNLQKQVHLGVLARMCAFFGCQPGDLLVLTPDGDGDD